METAKLSAPNAPTSGGTSAIHASRSGSGPTPLNSIASIVAGKGPTAAIKPLTPRLIEILEARALDVELLAKHGVGASNRLNGDCIAIPYFENGIRVNTKYRLIGEAKGFTQDEGARKVFWNVDCLRDETLANSPLVITEGEFDALAAIMAGYPKTVSVPDGAPAQKIEGESRKYTYLDEAEALLRDCRDIILAVDGDGPGANLLHDLSIRLGKHRCKWVRYPLKAKGSTDRLKDLNEVLQAYGIEGVQRTLQQAQWCKVAGVYRMSELPPIAPVPTLDIGMVNLWEHYRMRPADFCVISGIPGHGKSSFINEVCGRMAIGHGWSTVFASFEQRPQTDHRRALRTFFNSKRVIHQTEQERAKADDWIDRFFSFIVPDEDDDVDLVWILERAAAAIVQHGAKIVVIDPWNEIDHVRPADMTLTEYTGFAIKQFRKLAKKYQVHVIVAAHPAKMKKRDDGNYGVPTLYDISDSANWANKADIGIIIHRTGDNPKDFKTLIRIAKSKYHDEIGQPGDLDAIWDPERNRYIIIDNTENSFGGGQMMEGAA